MKALTLATLIMVLAFSHSANAHEDEERERALICLVTGISKTMWENRKMLARMMELECQKNTACNNNDEKRNFLLEWQKNLDESIAANKIGLEMLGCEDEESE